MRDNSKLLQYDIPAGQGKTLRVISDPLSSRGYCIGSGLWSAAQEVIDFYAAYPDDYFADKRVLELGAGLGTVGQALALHGARVVLTDQAVMLPLMRHNVAANFPALDTAAPGAQIRIRELLWEGDLSQHPLSPAACSFDLLVASDVCYDEDSFAPLLSVLRQYAAYNPHMQVVLAAPDRPESRPFFHMARQQGFAWRVLSRVRRPDLATPVFIYQLVWAGPATSPGAIVPATQLKALVVFDFDWSLVEENSDTWVLQQLGAWDQFCRLKKQKLPWTQLMDASLVAALRECGASPADVAAACHSVPFHAAMQQAVRDIAATGMAELCILSDANSVYIQEILQHHKLQDFFSSVITNPALYEDGALRVKPYHNVPHGCPRCPSNLCKAKVLEQMLLSQNYSRVVYLGDGRGDFCPCTHLGPSDAILARTVYPDGTACSLHRLLAAEGAVVANQQQLDLGEDGVNSSVMGGTAALADAEGDSWDDKPLQPGADAPSVGPVSTHTISDHIPGVNSSDSVYSQMASEGRGSAVKSSRAEASVSWTAGDVAAPVYLWRTPSKAAALLRDILCL